MWCWISSATAPSWTRCQCSGEAKGRAWPDFSAVSILCRILTRCYECQAASSSGFGSFVFGTPGFPLSDVPLQSIANDIVAGRYAAEPSKVFRFEEIHEVHRLMEANEANGKMVVVHS